MGSTMVVLPGRFFYVMNLSVPYLLDGYSTLSSFLFGRCDLRHIYWSISLMRFEVSHSAPNTLLEGF